MVGTDLGASAILLGSFGTGTLFLLARIWVERRRLGLTLRHGPPAPDDAGSGCRRCRRSSRIYSLSFIDRIIIVRLAGLAEAGLYALAVKFANGMQVLARGFHLAWPPLAYSITDDDEARRAYALIVSWFVAVISFAVVGLWLLAPWLVRAPGRRALLRSERGGWPARRRNGALRAVPRAGRDPRPDGPNRALVPRDARPPSSSTSPSTCVLVPEYGIVGAGVALVVSYVVVLALMYAIVRRLFFVPVRVAPPRARRSASPPR